MTDTTVKQVLSYLLAERNKGWIAAEAIASTLNISTDNMAKAIKTIKQNYPTYVQTYPLDDDNYALFIPIEMTNKVLILIQSSNN